MESDPEFNAADYIENILNAARYDGSQYIFPTAYTFNYYAYDSSLIDEATRAKIDSGGPYALRELIELAAESFTPDGETKLLSATKFVLFDHLLNENYNKFIDSEEKTANFTNGEFEAMLELIEEYAQKGYLTDNIQRGETVSMEDMREARAANHYIKTQQSPMLLQFFNKNSNFRIQMGTSSNSENDVLAGVAADGNGEAPFAYSNAYAINSNSQNKDLAWEFIKFLSGPETADSLEIRGIPLNVEASALKAEKMITGEMRSGMILRGEAEAPEPTETELTEEQRQTLNDYLKTIEEYSARLTKLTIPDEAIISVIKTETENFFSGAKSASEVAAALQNRINLYLNE
jgi:multiple sugar transport system substrate-binding protein